MKVLMLSTDRKVFEAGSAVRRRLLEYGNLFEELHVVVLCRRGGGLRREKISENVWLHPTASRFRLLAPVAAVLVGRRLKRHFARSEGSDEEGTLNYETPRGTFREGCGFFLLEKS